MAGGNKKKKKKDNAKKSSAGLLIGAGVGVIALLLCCSGGGVGGYFWLREPAKAPPKIADADKGSDLNRDKVGDKIADKGTDGTKPSDKISDNVVKLPPAGDPIIIAFPASSRDLANDLRWAKGAAAAKLLQGGRWVATNGEYAQFNADGTYSMSCNLGVGTGRFKFVPPHHLEFDHRPSSKADTATTLRGVVLVDNDELALLHSPSTSKLKKNHYLFAARCFRLRPDGTGPARANVLDPAIEDIRSPDVLKRNKGFRTLNGCGPDAWPALRDVINVMNEDANFRSQAIGVVGNIGPKAKDAVPSLQTMIREKSHPHRTQIIGVLGKIGPSARDAIPDLVPYLKDIYPPIAEAARVALRQIDPKGTY